MIRTLNRRIVGRVFYQNATPAFDPGMSHLSVSGSAITNEREPRSCLGWVFNFKLGSFTDNTKIAEHANVHF